MPVPLQAVQSVSSGFIFGRFLTRPSLRFLYPYFDFGHVVVMKELLFAVIPIDVHARPIGPFEGALIGRAIKPSHALADFQFSGFFGSHVSVLHIKFAGHRPTCFMSL